MKRKPGASGARKRPPSKSAQRSGRKSAQRSGRKSPKRPASPVRHFSRATLQKRLARQKAQARVDRQKARAQAAVRHFRVRKADHGKFVLVTTKGNRGASLKGRKGYLIYISKKGRKSLATHTKDYKPKKATDIEAPIWRNRKAAKEFEVAKLELTSKGKAVVRGKGALAISGVNDFSDKIVGTIANSLKSTIERQASHRSFLISANVLIVKQDGSTRVYSFSVPIAKADHIAIELGGLKNFVRQKFYAFMARELAFDGYVSSGSANHVRRLSDNAGLPPEDWTQDDGQQWRGNESEIVHIKSIEWKIEQAK